MRAHHFATGIPIGILVVGAILSGTATAAAEPAPPPMEPSPATDGPTETGPSAQPIPPTLMDPLAQGGAPADIGGLPNLANLIDPRQILGQRPIPGDPGAGDGTPLDLYALNNAYLLPQHVVPSAPGQGEIFGVEVGQENSRISRIDLLRRLREQYHDGGLTGAMLGRRPVADVTGLPIEVAANPNEAAAPNIPSSEAHGP